MMKVGNGGCLMGDDRLMGRIGIDPAFRQIRFRNLCFGFYMGWVMLTGHLSLPSLGMVGQIDAFLLVMGATFLAVLLLGRRRIPSFSKQLRHTGIEPVIATGGLSVGSLVLVLISVLGLDGVPMVLGGTILCGIGASLAVLEWGDFYASIGPKMTLACIGGSMSLTGLLELMALYFPQWFTYVGLVLFPLLIVFGANGSIAEPLCSVPIEQNASKRERVIEAHAMPRNFWYLIIGVSAFGCFFSVMTRLISNVAGSSLFSTNLYLAIFGIFGGALLLAGTVLFDRSFDLGFTWRPIVPFMVGAIALIPFLPVEMLFLSRVFVSSAWFAVRFLTLVVISSIVNLYGVPVRRAYCIGWIAITVPVALSTTVAGVFLTDIVLSSTAVLAVSSIVIFLVILASTFLLNERNLTALSPVDGQGSVGDTLAIDKTRSRCDAFALKHGLSDRQRDILILLAQGRGRTYAARELGISENTVRTHITNLYTKLGIHSKDELLDLLEAVPDEEMLAD